RVVEVQVVLREVGEQLHRVADARDTAELERVRGDLHGDGRVAGVEHSPGGRSPPAWCAPRPPPPCPPRALPCPAGPSGARPPRAGGGRGRPWWSCRSCR